MRKTFEFITDQLVAFAKLNGLLKGSMDTIDFPTINEIGNLVIADKKSNMVLTIKLERYDDEEFEVLKEYLSGD
jgi:hypothetical protein